MIWQLQLVLLTREADRASICIFLSQSCYGLNICVSPKFLCSNSNPSYNHIDMMVLGGGVFMMNEWEWMIWMPLRYPLRAQKPLLPCEDARSQLRCRGTPSDHPDLGLPDFRTIRNKMYCLQTIQSVVFCYGSLNGLRYVIDLNYLSLSWKKRDSVRLFSVVAQA